MATYSLHHLTDGQKIAFLRTLLDRLKVGGRILIGDIAFATREELEKCRLAAGEEWDEEEIYFVADEWKDVFLSLYFEPVSHCADILTLAP